MKRTLEFTGSEKMQSRRSGTAIPYATYKLCRQEVVFAGNPYSSGSRSDACPLMWYEADT